MKKIYLHIGHGGADSGAVGKISNEKDITLKIGKLLLSELKQNGFDVDMSRTTDIKNVDAPKKANAFKSDIVISLHCNSADNSSASGVETLVYAFGGQAEKLADKVNDKVVNALKTKNRGVKEQNVEILRETYAPAILVEMGFISNPDEEKKLNNLDYQEKIAQAICKGVCEYFNVSYRGDNMKFVDETKISSWAKSSVDNVSNLKIMVGDSVGRFNPKNPITREEIAVVINKLLKFIKK